MCIRDRGKRYMLEELLNALPKKYILGRLEEGWFCKPFSESYSDVKYYDSAIEACAYAYIRI